MQDFKSCITGWQSSHGPSARLSAADVEALVTTTRLEVAAGHLGQPLLFLTGNLDLGRPHAACLVRRAKVTIFRRAVRGRFRLVPVLSGGRLQLQALHGQLLDAISQAVGAVLDFGPEIVAPECVFAHSPLQGCQPEVERRQPSLSVRHVVALQMVGKQTSDRDKPDGGLGVHHVQHDAGRAPLHQVPVMFLAQDTVQPGIRTAGFATKRTFGFLGPLAGQHTRCNPRGLAVQQEHRQQQCVNDIAVETERFLAFMRARMSMHSAETVHTSQEPEHTNPI